MLTSSRPTGTRTVVIGLGNPLMGDDGLGLIALAQLQAGWHVPDAVDLVDGGTWGITLLPVIESAARLLLIDAIEMGAPPGMLHTLERGRIPRYLATKISPHQVDLHDVLALAELRGTFPAEAMAIGLQPTRIEFGHGLSDVVACRVDELVRAAVMQLERWGHVCAVRADAAVAHA